MQKEVRQHDEMLAVLLVTNLLFDKQRIVSYLTF